ncbi:MAG: phosphoenolpyruvate carboxylase [Xanthomonadales bacterium]|nr:phosphoenolpyruvate carboxylase [Gammaproteobacteria bacterium]MBT8053974.1 phosphoenolpyruvate carboxylase [Gammaproteobacteria bacterium]NNK51974.1 phosphoenolpyruvate carboxylase [Xanthomonadales bacterium]
MAGIRKIQIPEKDLPLRADVSLLGSLVGDVLVDQHGTELLEQVEAVRKASIRQRESNEGGERLEAVLSDIEPAQATLIIQAFTSYLRAVNLAEKVHRIRRRRAYQRAGAAAQRGSLEAVLGELKATGADGAALAEAIAELRIQPVFTAHPTEATRRTIQEKEYDIVLRLVERLNPELTPGEEELALQRIRAAITSSWQTRLVPHARPTVADELDNILFYITDILYRVVPVFYEAAEDAYQTHFGESPPEMLRDIILRFGSWVGGDMDGNPNVTSTTILETLATQRAVVIRRYLPEVRRLARYLSQSTSEIGVSEKVARQLHSYRQMMPDIYREIPERHLDMPYRCLLKMIATRLESTLAEGEQAYSTNSEFAADIKLIRNSLLEHKGKHAGLFGIERLLRRIRTFGFHLVTLDVRQDALLHRRVMGELLGCEDWEARDPSSRAATLAHLLDTGSLPALSDESGISDEAADTLAVFRAISSARSRYGEAAIGLFIISMTQGADDVLTAQALSEIANPRTGASARLDIAPLLETVDDLEAGPKIIRSLLSLDGYRQHLEGLAKRQAVMVGYSDSSKDSGIVASRWALHEAQRRLVEEGQTHDVRIVFFHGRGGTVSRGGGNLVNGILGAPPGTVNGFLRVTEQGEVINQKYGVRFLALRNLELVAGATLAHRMGRASQGLSADESEIVAFMAQVSRSRFRSMVYEDPEFPSFFRSSTPLDVIEKLNIGSRPASRRSGEGIENLRAIPWVFSWAQVRVGFPGVFGFGTALDQAIVRFGMEKIRDLLNRQVFFQGMINDVEMVLGKSELGIGARYAGLAGPSGVRFFAAIKDEFQLAENRILELKQLDTLLDDQAVLQRNIRLRNPYVDPLHLLQIDMLGRWRQGGREDDELLEALKATVKGVALGIQNTG